MNLRRFRALHEAGATYKEIAEACGLDWRTVKKYLSQPGPVIAPRASSRKGTQPQVITPYAGVIDAMLRADVTIRAATVYERLVAEHGYGHSYQRVKLYVAQARPRVAAEQGTGVQADPMRGLHRRFEVTPGAQAQVDWGEEGGLLAHAGIGKVYSFHMTLSYSRDPFCVYTTATDLVTFFDCHRRAFAHFGGYVGDFTSTISCLGSRWSLPSRSSHGVATGLGTAGRCRRRVGRVAGACADRRLPGVRRCAVQAEHAAGNRL
ncbi:hypothetical protein AB0M95_35345 [Sphaerisporangium sp. NPDC051017]|uniref:hypothetical protein n=1 Tax=Sphaerisporangium sp. NPDC051017 TaxID=3154636 RepID=UPI00341DC37B